MTRSFRFVLFSWFCWAIPAAAAEAQDEPLFGQTLSVSPGHISTDSSVKYDYDNVYVRARRAGDQVHKRY